MIPLKISDIGEKRLIAEFVRPLFNASNEVEGVGDDCAMVETSCGEVWLFSTDRVPADLISFKLGILDYGGLGKYLARLNISDIAACGGEPAAILLNLGLPGDLSYEDFKALCRGFGQIAETHGCRVLGGDITSSKEISISATSIGRAKKNKVLTRRGAKKGDIIFASRPLGLTPAAFAYYLREQSSSLRLTQEEILTLNSQFTSLEPLVSLGLALSASDCCTSCMDNTDGVGQSLMELSVASKASFIIRAIDIELPLLVSKIAQNINEDPIQLAFSAGADFSLIGTLDRSRYSAQIENKLDQDIKIIGYVDDGEGVHLEISDKRERLNFSGWNYFSSQ